MPRISPSSIPTRLVSRPVAANEAHADFSFWGPTCDTIDCMKGPFSLPEKVKEGDYIEIGNTGAYGRAIAGKFNGYGAYRGGDPARRADADHVPDLAGTTPTRRGAQHA